MLPRGKLEEVTQFTSGFQETALKKLKGKDLTDPVNERFILALAQLRRAVNGLKYASMLLEDPYNEEGRTTLRKAVQLLLVSNVKAFGLDDIQNLRKVSC